jgi:putative membrane protein
MKVSQFGLLAAIGVLGVAGAAWPAESDNAFIQKAIAGDSSEIMLGQLAQTRAGSPEVKDFGRMLVTDHTRAREQALRTAAMMGFTASTDPTDEAKAEGAKLSALSGAAFDAEFRRYMVADHQDDISDFRKEAQDGQEPAAGLAKQTLPTLEKHLAAARDLTVQPQ